MKFNCPHCSLSLEADQDLYGERLDCPGCSAEITVPKPPPPDTKTCPFCAEEIKSAAKKCKHCGEHLAKPKGPKVAATSGGKKFNLPSNQGVTQRRRPARKPQKEVQTNVRQGAAVGGGVCFIVGMVLMFVSLMTFFLYVPLFIAAFILSIVAMAQGRVAAGLVLLLLTLIVPTVTGFGLAYTRGQALLEELEEVNTSSSRFEPSVHRPKPSPVQRVEPRGKLIIAAIEAADSTVVSTIGDVQEVKMDLIATSDANKGVFGGDFIVYRVTGSKGSGRAKIRMKQTGAVEVVELSGQSRDETKPPPLASPVNAKKMEDTNASQDDALTLVRAEMQRATSKFHVRRDNLSADKNPHGSGYFVYSPQTRYAGVERLIAWFVHPPSGTVCKLNGATAHITPNAPWPREICPIVLESSGFSDSKLTSKGLEVCFGKRLAEQPALEVERAAQPAFKIPEVGTEMLVGLKRGPSRMMTYHAIRGDMLGFMFNGEKVFLNIGELDEETMAKFNKVAFDTMKAREIVRGEAERSQAEEQKRQTEAKRHHALNTGQKTITRVCTGALTKKLLDQYIGIQVSGDRVALEKILTAGLLTGQYRIFTKGETVYLTDSAILSGLAKVRPEGSTLEFWIPIEALSKL